MVALPNGPVLKEGATRQELQDHCRGSQGPEQSWSGKCLAAGTRAALLGFLPAPRKPSSSPGASFLRTHLGPRDRVEKVAGGLRLIPSSGLLLPLPSPSQEAQEEPYGYHMAPWCSLLP